MPARKDPKRKTAILEYVDAYFSKHFRTPSVREIAKKTGMGLSVAYRYLRELDQDGVIDYDGQTIRTEKIRSLVEDVVRVGVLGTIPCGPLELEEEYLDGYLNLPAMICGHGDYFALYASGDSMTGAGIDPGDLVILKKCEHSCSGDIVAVYVEGEGNTLKRYYDDPENRRVILHPENEKYSDIYVKDCKIQGVVKHVLKNY